MLFKKEFIMEKKSKPSLRLLWELFFTLFKIGLFTFGGGYAMIALFESEFVSKKKWMDHEEFLNMVAIAESTPGPIAINSATYIGYKQAGVLGSALCTLGVVLPSFTIIYIISIFFDAFLAISWVASAFRGIQACVVFLILNAGVKMLKKIKRPLDIAVMAATILCVVLFSVFAIKFSTIFYILIGAAIGLASYFIAKLKNKEKEESTK